MVHASLPPGFWLLPSPLFNGLVGFRLSRPPQAARKWKPERKGKLSEVGGRWVIEKIVEHRANGFSSLTGRLLSPAFQFFPFFLMIMDFFASMRNELDACGFMEVYHFS